MKQRYASTKALVDGLRDKYLDRFRLRQGAPRSVVTLLFQELKEAGAEPEPGRNRGYTFQELYDRVAADRFGEVPTPRAVQDGLREFRTNLRMFAADLEYDLVDVGGTTFQVRLAGPTAEERLDVESGRLWLHMMIAKPAPTAPEPPPTGGESLWIYPEERWPTEAGFRWLFSRLVVFPLAFTAEQASFLTGASESVLRELATRGLLQFDPMSGRFSVSLPAGSSVKPLPVDDEESLSYVYAALCILDQYRSARAQAAGARSAVDGLHRERALRILLSSMDLEIQDYARGALADEPNLFDVVSLLENISVKQEEFGCKEDAARTLAALAFVAGAEHDRELFEQTTSRAFGLIEMLPDDDKFSVRQNLQVVLFGLSTKDLFAVGWYESADDYEEDVPF